MTGMTGMTVCRANKAEGINDSLRLNSYLKGLGQCFQYNPLLHPMLTNMKVSNNGRSPILRIQLPPEFQWDWIALLIHNENDFPSAMISQPFFWLKSLNYYRICLKKNYISRVFTDNYPCQTYSFETCNDIENYKAMQQKYNCNVPLLNTGTHLEQFFAKNLKNCNESVTRQSIEHHSKG